MNVNKSHIVNFFVLLLITATSCVDEIALKTENFESILIVEATITNENKQQEILLSRSYMFDSIPVKETNATVRVIDDAANTYTFIEAEPGVYKSQITFAAQLSRNYNLSVVTSDGKEYGSNQKLLTQPTTIDNLYVERDFNENGIEGVSVYIDSYDPTGNSKYYRHEYVETYKIVAPLYSSEELLSNGVEFPILEADQSSLGLNSMQDLIDFLVIRQFRPEQEQICYKTEKSNTIIQTNTTEFLEDKLDKYRVHFINRESAKIRERYSILVRQYVQSREAFVFYETLNSFSGSESVFSEDQPGFLEGNVFSTQSIDEKVFGFFEVTSVDEKRIFFNYADLFSNEPLPSYFLSCDDFYTPVLLKEDLVHNWIGSPLVDAINEGYQFYDENVDGNNSPYFHAPFRLVLGPCGDCTFLGNNNVPEFWID